MQSEMEEVEHAHFKGIWNPYLGFSRLLIRWNNFVSNPTTIEVKVLITIHIHPIYHMDVTMVFLYDFLNRNIIPTSYIVKSTICTNINHHSSLRLNYRMTTPNGMTIKSQPKALYPSNTFSWRYGRSIETRATMITKWITYTWTNH